MSWNVMKCQMSWNVKCKHTMTAPCAESCMIYVTLTFWCFCFLYLCSYVTKRESKNDWCDSACNDHDVTSALLKSFNFSVQQIFSNGRCQQFCESEANYDFGNPTEFFLQKAPLSNKCPEYSIFNIQSYFDFSPNPSKPRKRANQPLISTL